ncbi:MAG: hypothetical protein NXI20_20310, partial [bacterium]|nr:hypothetical protein [bacterium]
MTKHTANYIQDRAEHFSAGSEICTKVNLVRNLTFSILVLTLFGASAFAQNEFISTWKTDNAGTSGSTEITIPVSDNGG